MFFNIYSIFPASLNCLLRSHSLLINHYYKNQLHIPKYLFYRRNQDYIYDSLLFMSTLCFLLYHTQKTFPWSQNGIAESLFVQLLSAAKKVVLERKLVALVEAVNWQVDTVFLRSIFYHPLTSYIENGNTLVSCYIRFVK